MFNLVPSSLSLSLRSRSPHEASSPSSHSLPRPQLRSLQGYGGGCGQKLHCCSGSITRISALMTECLWVGYLKNEVADPNEGWRIEILVFSSEFSLWRVLNICFSQTPGNGVYALISDNFVRALYPFHLWRISLYCCRFLAFNEVPKLTFVGATVGVVYSQLRY